MNVSNASSFSGYIFKDILAITVQNPSKLIFLFYFMETSKNIISNAFDCLGLKVRLYFFKN
jgi:hypothetical protein